MTPDLSLITAAFVEFGGDIFMRNVNDWNIDPAIAVYKKVNKPQVLPKMSAVGVPQPYRVNDDSGVQGVQMTDRTLLVYQSKWDYDVDPEAWRNTYLANDEENPYYQFILNQIAKEYLAQLNDITIYNGVYNAAGVTPVDIATGWGSIIAAEILAGNLVPVVTGVITAANAVTAVETLAAGAPTWMKEKQTTIFCSWQVFEFYKVHYRSAFGFSFQKRENGEYMVDGYANMRLKPVSWMGTSQRLILTAHGNLIVGTDADSVSVHASTRRNLIEVRQMMPIGLQIADLEALVVNEQV